MAFISLKPGVRDGPENPPPKYHDFVPEGMWSWWKAHGWGPQEQRGPYGVTSRATMEFAPLQEKWRHGLKSYRANVKETPSSYEADIVCFNCGKEAHFTCRDMAGFRQSKDDATNGGYWVRAFYHGGCDTALMSPGLICPTCTDRKRETYAKYQAAKERYLEAYRAWQMQKLAPFEQKAKKAIEDRKQNQLNSPAATLVKELKQEYSNVIRQAEAVAVQYGAPPQLISEIRQVAEMVLDQLFTLATEVDRQMTAQQKQVANQAIATAKTVANNAMTKQ